MRSKSRPEAFREEARSFNRKSLFILPNYHWLINWVTKTHPPSTPLRPWKIVTLSPFFPSLVLIFFAPRFTSRSFQLSERLECAAEWYDGEIAKGPGQALQRCWHLRVSLTIKFLWEKCALMLLLLVFSKPLFTEQLVYKINTGGFEWRPGS